ncbi:uncharacterized protein HMPREF1541_01381 [Cyphellophora europaea CBS 101466]|uniref:Uncharacterized protein n=1 Tax=Cyphellophora europaea (strain CBS 101466) TaxID=1220924 RepID=W2SEX9_CYPE1|nr:uncharacterized protein HMPREF1541_01381 [Cyphellophora europaea CBS 101466]ETN47190.1 hypothetical protein HMPREF1541_01381 [Cyphellophora europaea CBS 101466]
MSLMPLNWFIPMSVTFGGWLGGGLSSMAGLWQDTRPKTPTTSTVRIWVGMDPNREHREKSSLAGRLPMANLYDERGDSLGGAWALDPDRQVPEVVKDWNSDAVCMSAIAVMFPDGGEASILGDVPHGFCGWSGYPSLTEIDFDGKGSAYRPFCFWIDFDDSYRDQSKPWNPRDHLPLAMSFHLPDFNGQNATKQAYNDNKDLICKSSARMQARRCLERSIPIFDPPLNYGNQAGNEDEANHLDPTVVLDSEVGDWPQTRGGPGRIRTCSTPQRRKRARRNSFEGQWVHSLEINPKFSATEICKMSGLRGPHYANVHEGKFCNVEDRSVWDICNEQIKSNCFDLELEELLVQDAVPFNASTDGLLLADRPRPRPVMKLNKRIDMT